MAVLVLSGPTLIKAGANVSAVMAADANLEVEQFILEAQSLVNCVARFNFSDATLNADVQNIINEVVSNIAAIYCIQYDMSGYTSRIEAEDMVNILRDGALRGLSILRDQKAVTFINGA